MSASRRWRGVVSVNITCIPFAVRVIVIVAATEIPVPIPSAATTVVAVPIQGIVDPVSPRHGDWTIRVGRLRWLKRLMTPHLRRRCVIGTPRKADLDKIVRIVCTSSVRVVYPGCVKLYLHFKVFNVAELGGVNQTIPCRSYRCQHLLYSVPISRIVLVGLDSPRTYSILWLELSIKNGVAGDQAPTFTS